MEINIPLFIFIFYFFQFIQFTLCFFLYCRSILYSFSTWQATHAKSGYYAAPSASLWNHNSHHSKYRCRPKSVSTISTSPQSNGEKSKAMYISEYLLTRYWQDFILNECSWAFILVENQDITLEWVRVIEVMLELWRQFWLSRKATDLNPFYGIK